MLKNTGNTFPVWSQSCKTETNFAVCGWTIPLYRLEGAKCGVAEITESREEADWVSPDCGSGSLGDLGLLTYFWAPV